MASAQPWATDALAEEAYDQTGARIVHFPTSY